MHQGKKEAAASDRQDGRSIVASPSEAPTTTIGIVDFTIGAGVDGDYTGSTCTEGQLRAVGRILVVATRHGTRWIKADRLIRRYRDTGLVQANPKIDDMERHNSVHGCARWRNIQR